MLRLHNMQQAFAGAIIEGNYSAVAREITPGGSAFRSIALYRRLVRTNYTQVLSITFPVLRRFVGPRYFDILARGYLKKYHSNSGDLFSYGRHLPVLLLELQVPRSLVELARLDWACHEVYQAADSPSLSHNQLDVIASVEPSHVTFRLNRTARLLRFCMPVHRVWLALQPDAPADLVVDLPLPDEETFVVVTRTEGRIHVAALAALDYQLLEAMANRKTVAEVERLAMESAPEFDFSRFMAAILHLNVLAGLSERCSHDT